MKKKNTTDIVCDKKWFYAHDERKSSAFISFELIIITFVGTLSKIAIILVNKSKNLGSKVRVGAQKPGICSIICCDGGTTSI
jgi:hypothetical protein